MQKGIAALIGAVIANLGYPVGMGMPPNPETMDRLAAEILKLANEQSPVMWRVMDDNVWRVFSDEREAANYAEKIGMDYQGLYARQ